MGNPSAPAAPRSPARPAPMGTEAVMKFLFDDESFSFEALRTAGFTLFGGADLGEVLATIVCRNPMNTCHLAVSFVTSGAVSSVTTLTNEKDGNVTDG